VTSRGKSRVSVPRAVIHLLAATLAISSGAVAHNWQSTAIGGADQYGYVTAAGLLGQGSLTIEQDIGRQTPWPGAASSWTPIGYTEAGRSVGAIAPVPAIGLPLLILGVQWLFGFCAAFWIVPLCAGAAVWFTYMLGCGLFDREGLALAGSALLAVSPIFLMQSTTPLSDVPATAAWTGALAFLVIDRPFAAGLAASVAIAIRPNLVPVSLVLVAWVALRDLRTPPDHRYVSRIVRLALGIAPAIVGIAWLNARVYGSPIRSGYGDLETLYSWSYLWANVSRFSRWAAASETPIVAFAAVFMIAPTAAPPVRVPSPRLLLGGFCAVVVLSYLFYLPFDGWWYLRFLLPMWPVVMLLTVATIDGISGRWLRPPARHVAVGLLLAALAVHHVMLARNEHVFARWHDELRYVDVARWIAVTTDPSAVFISWQESGSIRLYADRLTLNFARLDRRWLDRAVDRLRAMGRQPYIVVEGFEREAFRQRFSASNRLGALDWTPLAVLQTPYVAIYGVDRDTGQRRPVDIPSSIDRPGRRCQSPAVWPPRLHLQ
jgi:hypothetical protein